MTIDSFTARMAKVNGNLRFRKKTPFVGLHGPMMLVGLYQRNDYMGFCLGGTDIWYRSIPTKYRKITNLVDRKDIIQTVRYKQRGRFEFIALMRSKGLIGRVGQQLLRL
jgi:hypothetical protein